MSMVKRLFLCLALSAFMVVIPVIELPIGQGLVPAVYAASSKNTKSADVSISTRMKKLEAELRADIGRAAGSWSVYVKRLDTGDTINISARRRQQSASLIKLFIAGAYEQQLSRGKISSSYLSKMDSMLSESSNSAANTLISKLGYSKINRFIAGLSFGKTVCARKMLQKSKKDNYTSALDCGRFLELLYKGRIVNRKASARILSDLKAQKRRNKIPAGIPSWVTVANKTGELTNVQNDAAIVYSPECTYIIVVMAQNINYSSAQNRIIRLSRMVYKAMNP